MFTRKNLKFSQRNQFIITRLSEFITGLAWIIKYNDTIRWMSIA